MQEQAWQGAGLLQQAGPLPSTHLPSTHLPTLPTSTHLAPGVGQGEHSIVGHECGPQQLHHHTQPRIQLAHALRTQRVQRLRGGGRRQPRCPEVTVMGAGATGSGRQGETCRVPPCSSYVYDASPHLDVGVCSGRRHLLSVRRPSCCFEQLFAPLRFRLKQAAKGLGLERRRGPGALRVRTAGELRVGDRGGARAVGVAEAAQRSGLAFSTAVRSCRSGPSAGRTSCTLWAQPISE